MRRIVSSMLAVFALAGMSAVPAGAAPLSQWATGASATNSYPNYGAELAIGAPNATSCSDTGGQAWTYDGRTVPSALTLTYATPVKATAINIVFSNPLSDTLTVEIANGTGAFTLVTTLNSAQSCGNTANYTVNVPVTGNPLVNTVRITMVTDNGWPEIDAVQLVGATLQVPSAPRALKVAYSTGKSTFSWSAPASNGNAAIRNYDYCTQSCSDAANWTSLARGKTSVTLAEAKGTSGKFYVRAVTANGPGTSASISFRQTK